jgi:hypothetical protein
VQGEAHEEVGHDENLGEEAEDVVPQSPLEDVLKAASLFCRKFPELSFVHVPSFSEDLRQARDQNKDRDRHGTGSRVRQHSAPVELVGTALLVTWARLRRPVGGVFDQVNPKNTVHFLQSQLVTATVQGLPHIYTVQALLVLSMCIWGEGDVPKAWMYSGKLARLWLAPSLL